MDLFGVTDCYILNVLPIAYLPFLIYISYEKIIFVITMKD